MINQTIELKLLTPCFCTGAQQSNAEIRASSLRGALRWWFRALGGTAEKETQVFGNAAGQASSLQIRVSSINPKPFNPPKVGGQNDPLAYILYYASIAGNPDGKAKFGTGTRWQQSGAIGADSTFTLHIRQLRHIDPEPLEHLEKTIAVFRHLGSIGLRVTRGLGALQDVDSSEKSLTKAIQTLKANGFEFQKQNHSCSDWTALMKAAGRLLKDPLRAKYGAGGVKKPRRATALGNIEPERQSSALYLRPVEIAGKLHLCAFEAPHDRVLGELSQRTHNKPILQKIKL